MHHLINVTIIALGAMGFWAAMTEGNILHRVRKFVVAHLPEWMHEPFATCPRCMVTIYGTGCVLILRAEWAIVHVGEWLAVPIITEWPMNPAEWLAYLVCAAGLQEIAER
jgi:hypothetical protein